MDTAELKIIASEWMVLSRRDPAECEQIGARLFDAAEEIDRLCAEVAALREDAERYRWIKTRKSLDLRSDCGEWRRADGTTFTASHYLAEGGTQHAPAESLDETIDNARKA